MQLDLLQAALTPAVRAAKPPRKSKPEISGTAMSPEETSEDKAPGAFKTISEAAKTLGVPQHVLRFWEGRFPQIKPLKLHGGRRYYRPEDMEVLTTIKNLLYKQGYTIEGAKKAFGVKAKPAPAAAKPPAVDKRHNQLSVIRQELVTLRETLEPYLS